MIFSVYHSGTRWCVYSVCSVPGAGGAIGQDLPHKLRRPSIQPRFDGPSGPGWFRSMATWMDLIYIMFHFLFGGDSSMDNILTWCACVGIHYLEIYCIFNHNISIRFLIVMKIWLKGEVSSFFFFIYFITWFSQELRSLIVKSNHTVNLEPI